MLQQLVGQTNGIIADVDSSGNLKTTLGGKIASEDLTNDVLKVDQRVSYANLSASGLVKTGAGRFYGVIVNSHTSGTLKFWDQTTAAVPVLLNTITFPAGPVNFSFDVGISFGTGLYVTVGGTIDFTVLYN